MADTKDRSALRVCLLHEVLFSVYLPFLIVTVHENANGSDWANRLVHWAVSTHRLRPTASIEDYRVQVVDFLLLWLSAAVIFLCLRLLMRFSLTKPIVRGFAGLCALAGFPVAGMYEKTGRLFSASALLIILMSSIALFLWARHKWPERRTVNISLLVLYNAVWSSLFHGLGRGWIAIWPSWHWTWPAWKYMWVAYPVLGLCLTLVWAWNFRQSEEQDVSGFVRPI